MLAMSVRVRPCSALCWFSSEGRVTVRVSPSTLIVRSSWNVFFSSPFGPFTVTVLPSVVIVTFFGNLMGSLPILDMVGGSLPDQRQELAAGARLARLAVGH